MEDLEIIRCENGVGEWEIHPTGETFDTRKEAEKRLAELQRKIHELMNKSNRPRN